MRVRYRLRLRGMNAREGYGHGRHTRCAIRGGRSLGGHHLTTYRTPATSRKSVLRHGVARTTTWFAHALGPSSGGASVPAASFCWRAPSSSVSIPQHHGGSSCISKHKRNAYPSEADIAHLPIPTRESQRQHSGRGQAIVNTLPARTQRASHTQLVTAAPLALTPAPLALALPT